MEHIFEEEEINPKYIRVTEILSPLSDFSMVPEQVLENKTRIGTEVHNAIELYLSGFPYLLSDDAKSYFESFLHWHEDSNVRVVTNFLEERYYDDELMITGKIDALVRFPDDELLTMCDWKTTASCTVDIKRSWELQGTFYHYLLKKNEVQNINDRFLFIQLSKEGKKPRIREFEFTESNMKACRDAVKYFRHYERYRNQPH